MAPTSYTIIHHAQPLDSNHTHPSGAFVPPIVRRYDVHPEAEDPNTDTPLWAIVVGIFVLPVCCLLVYSALAWIRALIRSHQEKARAKHEPRTMTIDMDRCNRRYRSTVDLRTQGSVCQSRASQPTVTLSQQQDTFPNVSRPATPPIQRRDTLPGSWRSDTASIRSDIPQHTPVWRLTAANLKKLRILNQARLTQYRRFQNNEGVEDGGLSVPGAWLQAPPPVYTRDYQYGGFRLRGAVC